MRKKPLITSFQLVMMALGSALVFPYMFMPILNGPPANQDVWFVLILTLPYIIVINAPILFIMRRFRGRSAAETFEMIMGKPIGKTFAFFNVLFFIFCSTACMDITGLFIKIYFMSETPFWAIIVFLIVPLAYLSFKGAGAIGRSAPFLIMFLIFTIFFFFIFGIGKMDPKDLQPVLAESTFFDLNLGAFLTAARYSEILILFVFSFYLSKQANIIKAFGVALSVFAVCFMLILLPTIMVLGDEYARHSFSAYYSFAGQVEAFGFITRVQALFVLALFPVAILKVTMYNYMASHVLAGVLGAKSHRAFVIPFAAVSFAVCMIPVMQKTHTFLFLTSDRFFPFVILPVIFVIPVIMLIVYFFRRKKISAALMSKVPEGEDEAK